MRRLVQILPALPAGISAAKDASRKGCACLAEGEESRKRLVTRILSAVVKMDRTFVVRPIFAMLTSLESTKTALPRGVHKHNTSQAYSGRDIRPQDAQKTYLYLGTYKWLEHASLSVGGTRVRLPASELGLVCWPGCWRHGCIYCCLERLHHVLNDLAAAVVPVDSLLVLWICCVFSPSLICIVCSSPLSTHRALGTFYFRSDLEHSFWKFRLPHVTPWAHSLLLFGIRMNDQVR